MTTMMILSTTKQFTPPVTLGSVALSSLSSLLVLPSHQLGVIYLYELLIYISGHIIALRVSIGMIDSVCLIVGSVLRRLELVVQRFMRQIMPAWYVRVQLKA